MRVAAIPVGYADGFPCKPHVGQRPGSVGRQRRSWAAVCMDQTVVDITQIEIDTQAAGPVRAGEEVVLIGRQGDARLSAEEASRRVRTNNYDIVSRILGLCAVGGRARIHHWIRDLQDSCVLQ